MAYLYPPAGTYACRNVAGADEPSMHGWGAAIDINTALSDYWRWHRLAEGRVPAYVNRIPQEIVTIFQRHGFIWGGRWAHFDTMHFEYRPELLGDNPEAEAAQQPFPPVVGSRLERPVDKSIAVP